MARPEHLDRSSALFQARNRWKEGCLGAWKHDASVYTLDAQTGHFEWSVDFPYYHVVSWDEAACRYREIELYYYVVDPSVSQAPVGLAIQEIVMGIVAPAGDGDQQRYTIEFVTPPVPQGKDLRRDEGISIELNAMSGAISFINEAGDITLQELITHIVPRQLREYTIDIFARVPIDAAGNTVNKKVSTVTFISTATELPPEVEAALARYEAGEVPIDEQVGAHIDYFART